MRKPRRVKRAGNRTGYLVAAVVVVALLGAGGWYFLAGPGGSNPVVSATSSSTSSSSTSSATSATSGCAAPPDSLMSNPIYARINTSKGTVEVELFPAVAPQTVANFVNLSKSGFYDNLVWHRIVSGFVIQTGDPLTRNGDGNRSLWGTGGSSKTVPLETNPSVHNCRGYLGMARGQDVNSGTSQFYINLANNPSLDGSYTVFGRVVSGMNVVDEIAAVPVNSLSQPVSPVYMTSVTILSGGP